MTSLLRTFCLSIIVLSVFACSSIADTTADTISDLTAPMIIVGEMGLYFNGDSGKQEAINGAKALLATGVITEALKSTVHEKRLESDDTDSFPSAHTAGAFAMATVISNYRPEYKWPAYTLAATVGWSRVEKREHRWRDVIAGAAIGYFTADKITKNPVTITPAGISLNMSW
jgi:membrane-associated phospholipid phosphatase